MDLVSDIKARLNIEDLVSSYVQLKKVGRNFRGLCPFHHEKTPSFYVSREKQLAYCFGCHQGGDLFDFIQRVESVDFSEAIRILAERAGLDYRQYRASSQKVPSKSEKQPFFEAHEKATAFFVEQLWKTSEGGKVLEYLHQRGLQEKTIRDFQVGFAPDRFDALCTELFSAKFDRRVLLESGLIVSKDVESEKLYDRFRARLMFPIKNVAGQIVAFGGRALKKDMEPKYLNSPETPLYHKSEILYALSDAKQTIREKGVLLVEGYMDCLACHQAGFSQTVATSGTALTSEHVRVLRRFTEIFYFCFDRDEAGWEASKRGFIEVLRQGGVVKFFEVPQGKDPAECLQKFPETFQEAFDKARSFFEVFLDRLFASHAVITPEISLHVMTDILPFLQAFPSRVALDLAVRGVARRLQVRESSIYEELNKSKESRRPLTDATRTGNSSDRLSSPPLFLQRLTPEQTVLAVLLQFPEKISFVRERLMLEDIDPFFSELFFVAFGMDSFDVEGFLKQLSDDALKKVQFLSFYGEAMYAELRPQQLEQDLVVSLDKIQKNRKNRRLETLKQQLHNFEREGKQEESRRVLEELRKVMKNEK